MKKPSPPALSVRRGDDDNSFKASFLCFASPCEILMEHLSEDKAEELATVARDEAYRIQQKFSRYDKDSVTSMINGSGGEPLELDEETSNLLDFAFNCYRLSDGLFDITSGILRRLWRFDGSGSIPSEHDVAELLPFIGMDKLKWNRPTLALPPGMELDLGGIGKEYAVDRCMMLLEEKTDAPLLINFGGDMRANRVRWNGEQWSVGMDAGTSKSSSMELLKLGKGAIATSGNSKRYIKADDKLYGHILAPRTGWPVEGCPLSVTVAAGESTTAGLLSTLAMLHGKEAEEFLKAQGNQYWLSA